MSYWPILLASILQYYPTDLEEGSNAIKYTGQSVFSSQRHPSDAVSSNGYE